MLLDETADGLRRPPPAAATDNAAASRCDGFPPDPDTVHVLVDAENVSQRLWPAAVARLAALCPGAPLSVTAVFCGDSCGWSEHPGIALEDGGAENRGKNAADHLIACRAGELRVLGARRLALVSGDDGFAGVVGRLVSRGVSVFSMVPQGRCCPGLAAAATLAVLLPHELAADGGIRVFGRQFRMA